MNKLTKTLIIFQAILFVVFLVTTSFFNRFAADDYYFIAEVNQKPLLEVYKHLHLNWHGRWTSNFLLLFFIKFYKIPFFLFLFNCITHFVLIISVLRMFKSINNYFNLNFKTAPLILYSSLFTAVFFFCTPTPNETWYWYTASTVYMWSISAFILVLSVVFKEDKSALDYSVFIISLLFIGGANEPLTIICLVASILFIIKRQNITLNIFAFIMLLSSFLVNYLSNGTIHREEITPNLSLIDVILYTGYSSLKFMFLKFHSSFLIALFLSLSFYFLGKSSNYSANRFNTIKEFVYSALFIGFIILINQSATVYALGGLAPDRSSITSSIFIALVASRYFFFLGCHHKKHINKSYYLMLIPVTILMVYNVYFFRIHQHFSMAYDLRIDDIRKTTESIIVLSPLPNSGYLYHAELSTDSNYFVNQHLKNGLNIQQEIKLETN